MDKIIIGVCNFFCNLIFRMIVLYLALLIFQGQFIICFFIENTCEAARTWRGFLLIAALHLFQKGLHLGQKGKRLNHDGSIAEKYTFSK